MSPETSAVPAQPVETRADRLTRLLIELFPTAKERIKAGAWGKGGPPYQFKTVGAGRQRLVIDGANESRLGFEGATRDDLLDQFEAHLKKNRG